MIHERQDFAGFGIQGNEYCVVGIVFFKNRRYRCLQIRIDSVFNRGVVAGAVLENRNLFRIAVLIDLRAQSASDQGSIYPPDLLT